MNEVNGDADECATRWMR